jgi:hypothetical protein
LTAARGVRYCSDIVRISLFPRRAVHTLVALSLLSASGARAAAPRACLEGITPETAQRLYATLNVPLTDAGCQFEGISTNKTELDAKWSRGGAELPPVHVALRACLTPPPPGSGPFVVSVPPAIAASCPSAGVLAARIPELLGSESPLLEMGSADAPLFIRTRMLFVGLLLLVVALMLRALIRRRAVDVRWIAVLAGSFLLALLVRGLQTPTLGNWYSEVLPAEGAPPWMRFGPGSFAFQSLLRNVLPWSERSLFASQIVLGALSVPMFLQALRELKCDLRVMLAVAVLFILAPFHVRLSASSSEHVLASALTVALLMAWLRALKSGDLLWLLLALVLVPAASLSRVETIIQVALVPLWTLLPDRVESSETLRLRRSWWRYVLFASVIGATAVLVYRAVVIPSKHPRPEAEAMRDAARSLVSQYGYLATHAPGWFSLTAVVLALIGVGWMLRCRPWLLTKVALTLAVAFIALGRTLQQDELVGARYFLFTIPVFLVLSGFGFDALTRILLVRIPRWRQAGDFTGLVMLAGVTLAQALPAYRARYAFQDEYAFARDAFSKLPAGCLVYQLPMRSEAFPLDTDCCLDVPRSPLVLQFPQLRFEELNDIPPLALGAGDAACVAYYESIACELKDSPELHRGWGAAVEFFRRRCGDARAGGHLEPLDHRSISPRATHDFFQGLPPTATLYRWTK